MLTGGKTLPSEKRRCEFPQSHTAQPLKPSTTHLRGPQVKPHFICSSFSSVYALRANGQCVSEPLPEKIPRMVDNRNAT